MLTFAQRRLQCRLMHHQRPCQRQRDALRLSCDSSTVSESKDIVLVHPTRDLERPQRALPVMKPRENLDDAPPVDHHLSVPFYELDPRGGLFPPAHAMRDPVLVKRAGRWLLDWDDVLTAKEIHDFMQFLRPQLRVDAVQPPQQMQHLAVSARRDRLAKVGPISRQFEPCRAGGLVRRHGGEVLVFPDQGAQQEDIIIELRGGGEVGRGGRDDAGGFGRKGIKVDGWCRGDGLGVPCCGSDFSRGFEFVVTERAGGEGPVLMTAWLEQS